MKTIETPSRTKSLVVRGDKKRDIGHDTFQSALGPLTAKATGFAMKICARECREVMSGLSEIVTESNASKSPYLVTHGVRKHKVRCAIRIFLSQPLQAPTTIMRGEGMRPGECFGAIIEVTHANRRRTQMDLRINCDRNGSYWINVRANPTSLLNAYNAFGVAFPGSGKHAERRIMMRVPFGFLRRIIRSTLMNFEWDMATQDRIKGLEFRNCPSQIFTYLLTAPFTPAKLMGYLRCVFATGYSAGDQGYIQLSDDLGLDVSCRRGPNGVETLLFIMRVSGRIAYSLCLYDKFAKATVDADIVGIKVGDADVRKFLQSAVRVDITIHDDGHRQMQREAKISKKECATVIAANYCKAIEAMDRGSGESGRRFIHWLLNKLFLDHLKIWPLLSYSPKAVERAHNVLEEYNPDAATGFLEWHEKGFRFTPQGGVGNRGVSFVQFLTQHASELVTPEIAKRARKKLMNLKFDPDIPLRAYDAFYNQTHAWDLGDEDRHRLAQAYEAHDAEAAASLHRKGRRNSEVVLREIADALVTMIEGAHVPANTLGITGA